MLVEYDHYDVLQLQNLAKGVYGEKAGDCHQFYALSSSSNIPTGLLGQRQSRGPLVDCCRESAGHHRWGHHLLNTPAPSCPP